MDGGTSSEQENSLGQTFLPRIAGSERLKLLHPFQLEKIRFTRPKTPEEAPLVVQQMAERHPDLLKIWVDDFFGATEPKMPPSISGAVIDEAHKHRLRVAAHIFHLEDAKSLLRDGLDIVAHSVRDEPVDQEFIQLMLKNHAAYIATLSLDEAQFAYAQHPSWMDSAAFRGGLSGDPAAMA